MAVLGLHCSVGSSPVAASRSYCWGGWTSHRAGLSCGSGALGLVGSSSCITRTPEIEAGGLSSRGSWTLETRLNSYGVWSYFHHGIWDFPSSVVKPVSPAMVGRFFTTVPPRKPSFIFSLKLRDQLAWWIPNLSVSPSIWDSCAYVFLYLQT